jgi:hypothetical protein
MTDSVKAVTLAILEQKITVPELQNLLQLIAQEINLRSTSNFAKQHGLSFNGVKNHRPHVLIDGIKFHAIGFLENQLPF